METWNWKSTFKIHEVLGLVICLRNLKSYNLYLRGKKRINQFIVSSDNVNANLFRMLPSGFRQLYLYKTLYFSENPGSSVNKQNAEWVCITNIYNIHSVRGAQPVAAFLHCLHLNIETIHGPCQPSGLRCEKTHMSSQKDTFTLNL